MPKFTVEVCRSHERNSTPAAWEAVYTGSGSNARREYYERLRVARGSGDAIRLVDASLPKDDECYELTKWEIAELP